MSKGFGKKALLHNKKGSKTNSNNNTPAKPTKQNNSLEDEDKLMVKFVFEGEKFHARTPICFDQLTLPDLLKKITLDITLPPPSANELFEAYFKEDIYPYIRHNIQSQIRNKRDITKLWDLQSIILQKIYEQRATLLRDEWINLRKQNKNALANKAGLLGDNDSESLRKKAELKAKNKANKQKWKDEIAMQIASGQFDEPKPKPAPANNAKSHRKNKKKKLAKPKLSKPSKPMKKKKVKKWKDKKTKKHQELWPVMKNTKSQLQTQTNKKMSAAQTLKENLKKMEQNNNKMNHLNNNNNSVSQSVSKSKSSSMACNTVHVGNENNGKGKRLLIRSELRYRLLIRGEHNEYFMENRGSNNLQSKQSEEIRKYIENLNENLNENLQHKNDLLCIKIWIHMCDLQIKNGNVQMKKQIWLNTDQEQIQLTMDSHGRQSKLFEMLWNDFGMQIKKRIDGNNINVVFVKKSKILRLKIPILS